MIQKINISKKIIDKREISDKFALKNQFEIISVWSTIETIFYIWQILENYREKKKVCIKFIELEKVYKWELKKKNYQRVFEWNLEHV